MDTLLDHLSQTCGNEHSLTIVERKLELLRKTTNQLHQQRNTLSAINSRVPREVLVDIFRYIVPKKFDGKQITHICHHQCFPDEENSKCDMKQWIPAIAHVCRHWRIVALSEPSLWIQCMPLQLDGLRTFLERSADVPMDLEVFFPGPPEYVDIALAQIPRARSLQVKVECTCLEYPDRALAPKQLVKLALQSMPRHLEYLRIGEKRDLFLTSGYTHQMAMDCLPQNLKTDENYFPKLRHVYLYWFPVSWNCGLLRRLQTLVIQGSNKQILMTPESLFEILKASPELEHLEMHWDTREDDLGNSIEGGDFQDTSSMITLPHLRSAQLNFGHSHIILAILHRVRFSPEARVRIHVALGFKRDVTESIMKAALAALERERRPLGKLGIACDELHVGIYGAVHGSTGFLSVDLTVSFIRGDKEEKTRLVERILLDQDLSHLHEFECHLDGTGEMPAQWWGQLFSRAPEVMKLCLRSKYNFCDALEALSLPQSAFPSASPGDRQDNERTLLPALEELYLYSTDVWNLLWNEVDRKSQLKNSNSKLYRLKRCLEVRSYQGHRIEKINVLMDTGIFDEYCRSECEEEELTPREFKGLVGRLHFERDFTRNHESSCFNEFGFLPVIRRY